MKKSVPKKNEVIERAAALLGGQKALADAIADFMGESLTQQAVSYWINGNVLIEAKYWAAIEHVTNGEITRADLRPDVFAAA